MAYNAVSVTLGAFQSSASHKCGGAGTSAPAGDVYLAWDPAKITKMTDLRHALQTALSVVAGGMVKE